MHLQDRADRWGHDDGSPAPCRLWFNKVKLSIEALQRTYVRNWRVPCQATKSRLTTDSPAGTMAIIGRHHPGATCSREVHLCASGSFRHSSRWLCSSPPRPLSWLIAPDRTSDRPRALDWLYTACSVVNYVHSFTSHSARQASPRRARRRQCVASGPPRRRIDTCPGGGNGHQSAGHSSC